MREFLEEATIMRGFGHPNVLSLIGVAMDKQEIYVVLPYMENGDLRSFVSKQVSKNCQNISKILALFVVYAQMICNDLRMLSSSYYSSKSGLIRYVLCNFSFKIYSIVKVAPSTHGI